MIETSQAQCHLFLGTKLTTTKIRFQFLCLMHTNLHGLFNAKAILVKEHQ